MNYSYLFIFYIVDCMLKERFKEFKIWKNKNCKEKFMKNLKKLMFLEVNIFSKKNVLNIFLFGFF